MHYSSRIGGLLLCITFFTVLIGCDSGGDTKKSNHVYTDPFGTGESSFLDQGTYNLRKSSELTFGSSVDEVAFQLSQGGMNNFYPDVISLFFYDSFGRFVRQELYRVPTGESIDLDQDSKLVFVSNYSYENDKSLLQSSMDQSVWDNYSLDGDGQLTSYTEFVLQDELNNLPLEFLMFREVYGPEGDILDLINGTMNTEYTTNGFAYINSVETINSEMVTNVTINDYRRDDLGRITELYNGSGVLQKSYVYNDQGALESVNVYSQGELIQIIRYSYQQVEGDFAVLAEAEDIRFGGYFTAVQIYEKVNCSDSVMLSFRHFVPDFYYCQRQSFWQ